MTTMSLVQIRKGSLMRNYLKLWVDHAMVGALSIPLHS